MIYTVGARKLYEDPDGTLIAAYKGVGGTVWRNLSDAEVFVDRLYCYLEGDSGPAVRAQGAVYALEDVPGGVLWGEDGRGDALVPLPVLHRVRYGEIPDLVDPSKLEPS